MRSLTLSALLWAGLLVPGAGHAETYLSREKAAEILLPGVSLTATPLDLSSEEVKAIEKAAGVRVLSRHLDLWLGRGHQALFVDRVIGKHDFITFALALDAGGKVLGVEIMEYLESYGKQVRGAQWRAQFVGRDKTAGLRVGKDIDALSGATLSATHVTAGVRRLLQTYAVIQRRLP